MNNPRIFSVCEKCEKLVLFRTIPPQKYDVDDKLHVGCSISIDDDVKYGYGICGAGSDVMVVPQEYESNRVDEGGIECFESWGVPAKCRNTFYSVLEILRKL